MIKLTLFGALCAVAMFVAWHAREERQCVFLSAIVVSTNWLLFSSYWIYAPLSPAFVVFGAGEALGVRLPVRHEDMWALTDLASLAVILVMCGRLWWSAFFIATYLAMLTMHAVAYVMGLEYLDYRHVLDAGLIIQLAVLLLLGGDGCGDYLLGRWDRLCNLVRPARASLSPFAREEPPR